MGERDGARLSDSFNEIAMAVSLTFRYFRCRFIGGGIVGVRCQTRQLRR